MGRPLLLTVVALLSPGPCIASAVPWSLRASPGYDVESAVAKCLDGVSDDALTPFHTATMPDLVVERTGASNGLRLAPLVSNLLNSRRVTALEDVGAPGGGEGYLRGIHRTIGVALRKPIF